MIAVVTEADLADLLGLVRGYCDFYGVQPSDQELLAMSRSLIADRDREGLQLIARARRGGRLCHDLLELVDAEHVSGCHDLFVAERARRSGTARR